MNPSIAFNYFKRIYGEVTRLSKRTGYNRFYHLWDYLSAFVRHGAHIRQYVIGDMWRMSNPERSRRLTFYRMQKLEKAHNDPAYVHLLRDKTDFNEFFAEFVHRGWMSVGKTSFNEFKDFVVKYGTIIIKPKDGKEGLGIRKFVYTGQDDAELQPMFDELAAEDALIEQCLIQHPDMVFGNTSFNTIRVMTVCSPDGKAHVMKAILRAGVGDSLVDNYALGGLIYEVDLNTGIVNSYGMSKTGELHLIHPNTDTVMLGYQLPKWDQVMTICRRAAEKLPQVTFIGWDVAVTADDVQLIEGNNSAEYEFYEYLGSNCYYEKIKAVLNEK